MEKRKANFIKKTGEFVRILRAAGRVRGDLLLGGKNARHPAEVIHKFTRCIHGLWINHGSPAWKKAIGRGNIHICTQSYPQLWITTCPFSTKFATASEAKFFWCWGQGHWKFAKSKYNILVILQMGDFLLTAMWFFYTIESSFYRKKVAHALWRRNNEL